jgi:hypothetical protein
MQISRGHNDPAPRNQGGAVASVVSFVNDDLFLDASGKNTGIVDVLMAFG